MPHARRRLTDKQKQTLLVQFNRRCDECKQPFAEKETIDWDHIVPLVFGGTNELSNFRPLHDGCHKPKSIREYKDAAKGRRLRGETKKRAKKKIQSPGFDKRFTRKLDGTVVKRTKRGKQYVRTTARTTA